MSEYMFGCGTAKVSRTLGRRIDKIASRHGAWFVLACMPDGWRYWFACPNRGMPFDQWTRNAVMADVEAAGIKLP